MCIYISVTAARTCVYPLFHTIHFISSRRRRNASSVRMHRHYIHRQPIRIIQSDFKFRTIIYIIIAPVLFSDISASRKRGVVKFLHPAFWGEKYTSSNTFVGLFLFRQLINMYICIGVKKKIYNNIHAISYE